MNADNHVEEGTTKRKRGRPPGSKSKPRTDEELLKDLVDTKCRLLKYALEKLQTTLGETTDPEERLRILSLIDDVVDKVEHEL